MSWDSLGLTLATCANEVDLKLWVSGDDQWYCSHSLAHQSPVVVFEWCAMAGKGDNPVLMLAR